MVKLSYLSSDFMLLSLFFSDKLSNINPLQLSRSDSEGSSQSDNSFHSSGMSMMSVISTSPSSVQKFPKLVPITIVNSIYQE